MEQTRLYHGDESGRDSQGIPVNSAYPEILKYLPVPTWCVHLVFICVGVAVGQAAAWPIYHHVADHRVPSKLQSLGSQDLGWLYLAVYVLKTGSVLLNIQATSWRRKARINVPDQHVYKVWTPPGGPALPYVMFETEGDLGRFNRSQRAVQNYQEYLPGVLVTAVMAGYVFPFPVFILTLVYVASRMVMAVRYTESSDGRKAGFILSLLVSLMLDGLLLLVAYKVITEEWTAPPPAVEVQ